MPSPDLRLLEAAEWPIDAARIVEASRDRLVIEAATERPGVLVVSEAHYPGWSVFVDGEPAELLRADYAFRGVVLMPGTHRVVMLYRPVGLYLGLATSALALLGLLVFLLLYRDRLPGQARPAPTTVLT
jgi:uncharacterized membrane protein YfhO